MIFPRLAFMASIIPGFQYNVRHHDGASLLGVLGLMTTIGALGGGAVYAGLTESMHRNLRGAGVGMVYACAVAVFGGTTQPAIAWLTEVTKDPLAPAWYMLGATVVGLIAVLFMRESAPAKLTSRTA
jgi:hypothetical protein